MAVGINYANMKLDFERVHIYPYDNTNVIVASLNEDFMLSIKSHFTLRKSNYQFSPSYKNGNWDGNIRFIWKNGLMPKGLLKECVQKLVEMNIKVKVHKSLLEPKLDIVDFEEFTRTTLLDKQETPMEPYPYQWAVAKKITENKRGVARAATSAGKTFMVAMSINYLLGKKEIDKILIIVPSVMLVVQMRENFIEEFGIDKNKVGMYMGSKKEADHPIVIATWQSLMNIKDNKFFAEYDMVVVDETHKATAGTGKTKKDRSIVGGSQIKQILDKCVNASRRIGVTGTMPTDEVDYKTVIGCTGPILIEVTAKELMDKGHITKLQIVSPLVSYDPNIVKSRMDVIKKEISKVWEDRKGELNDSDWKMIRFHAEKSFIETYIPRFKYISKLVNKRVEKNENTLILVHSIEYGENLVKILKKKVPDATYVEHICGEVPLAIREDLIKKMENNTKCVIVATMSIFGTGVSIKNLHTVIFGSTTKAKISVLQAIGRSLRKHESKECATVIDIVDELPYSQRHASERIMYYEEEGFDIRFVEVNI